MDFILKLQLFADGGDAGATGSNAATPTAEGSSPIAEGQSAEVNADERAKAYAQFKTDYKAEYDNDVQSIVKDRLKKSNAANKELNDKLSALSPILENMSKKYGVDANDVNAIMTAYNDDDSNYEDEAYEKGMTVDQVKAFREIERENSRLRAAEEERARQVQYAEWDRQAAELQQVYPNFDMGNELQNENFRRMMNAGVPIRTAYEVAHKDELMRGAMQFTAQKTATQVTNAVIANKARPAENGLSNNSASVSNIDISKLSRAQREDYKRRAAKGERITFKK